VGGAPARGARYQQSVGADLLTDKRPH